MKAKEIRDIGSEELVKQLEASRRELFDLRFRAATKQLANHREIMRVRRQIARMKTIITEIETSER